MIVLPRLLDAKQAFIPMVYGTTLFLIFELALFLFFLLNKKGMTIQDYLSNTKVLDLKK
jgi:hypothetical protein